MPYIQVPIGNLNPVSQIVHLLDGSAQIGLLNPWFSFPGVESPTLPNFMIVERKKGTLGIMTIINKNPAIVSRNPKTDFTGNFSRSVIFTEDNGESSPTTKFTLFNLNFGLNTNAKTGTVNIDKYQQFKKLQLIPSSRGKIGEDLTDIQFKECVINYQLTQAYEFCLIAKILGIEKFEYVENGQLVKVSNDVQFFKLINSKCNLGTINDSINKYLLFIHGPKSFIPRYKSMEPKIKYVDDLLWIMKEKLQEIIPSTSPYYGTVLSCSLMKPAVYPSIYKPTKNGIPDPSAPDIITCRCDYNVKYDRDKDDGTKHKYQTMAKAATMRPEDYRNLIGKRQEGKIFIKMDFDYRINADDNWGDAPKNVIRLRYIIDSVAHRDSRGAEGHVDLDGIDLEADGMIEENETTTVDPLSQVNL